MKKVLFMAVAALLMMGMASCSGSSSSESTEGVDSIDVPQFDDNKSIGRKFLEENAKNDSVKVTASGLQYMVLKEGTGAKPGPTDTVSVMYTGTLIDGTVFDKSMEPISFPLNGVIAGWTEGLQLMSEGSEYRLFIPSELAYGEKGQGSTILPNSALIFDVQLIKVVKQN